MHAAVRQARQHPPGTLPIPDEAVPRDQLDSSDFRCQDDGVGADRSTVAFTFNLDQPYWALLTVFIVSQPLQSGQVLAKNLYRIIGTVIGAGVALLFVALFAQERVLFLGALAW